MIIWLSKLGVAILFGIGVAGIFAVFTTLSIPSRSPKTELLHL